MMDCYTTVSPRGSGYDYLDTSRPPSQRSPGSTPPSSSQVDSYYYPLSPQTQADDFDSASLMVSQGSGPGDYLSPHSPVSPRYSHGYPSPGGYDTSGRSEGGSPAAYSEMAADDYTISRQDSYSTSYPPQQQGGGDYTDDAWSLSPMGEESHHSPSSSRHSSKGEFVCLVPGCKASAFKRNADLDRHYKHKHRAEDQKETFYCDYRKCPRKDSAFHRKDHFRDHLREFHQEDLSKRGKNVDASWVEKRSLKKDWWRCVRCLKRVDIHKHQWDCPDCKIGIDRTRKSIRSLNHGQGHGSGSSRQA